MKAVAADHPGDQNAKARALLAGGAITEQEFERMTATAQQLTPAPTATQEQPMTDTSPRRSATPPSSVYEPTGGAPAATGWTGWIVFGGVMLVMLGVFHVIEGIVALFREDFYLVGSSGLAVHVNYTTWGWAHLILGVIAGLAGIGLLAGNIVARVVGVGVAMLSAVANLLFVSAYPVWSIMHHHVRRAGDLGDHRARQRDEVRAGLTPDAPVPGPCTRRCTGPVAVPGRRSQAAGSGHGLDGAGEEQRGDPAHHGEDRPAPRSRRRTACRRTPRRRR